MKKHSYNRKTITCALCVLGGAVLALAAVVLGFGGLQGFQNAAKFASVMNVVRRDYVGEYDADELTDAAASAVIASLDDDWSYYMDEDTYTAYQSYSANVYQGIGVTIRQQEDGEDGFEIVSVTKDGPASLAGLVPGDVILSVDGQSVTGMTTDEVRALIQADYGGEAVLTVRSATDGTERTVSVACEEIYADPVTYELLDATIGYIAISNFRDGAGDAAIAAVEDLLSQGAERLVFDVRSNPGGQVSEMIELLDYLLPEGDLFIRVDKNGNEVAETSDADCVEVPMAVLVNADSYSAAEFFAAALREYDWATVVGQATTGKGRSQVTIPLWDGSAVHISKYSYLTPSRVNLYETGGITPDVEVSLTDEETVLYLSGQLAPQDDPQVQAAVAALAQS